jgi:hypothetical protein
MRIEARMPEGCIQLVDLVWRERVFLALRHGVHVSKRQPRLVREVPLEQTVSPDNLTSHAFALGRQLEILSVRGDEALLLHAFEQLHQAAIVEPQDSSERGKRPSPPAVLLIEEMLQRVFGPHPSSSHIAVPDAIDRGGQGDGESGGSGEEKDSHGRPFKTVMQPAKHLARLTGFTEGSGDLENAGVPTVLDVSVEAGCRSGVPRFRRPVFHRPDKGARPRPEGLAAGFGAQIPARTVEMLSFASKWRLSQVADPAAGFA